MDTLAIIKRIEMRLAEIGMNKADFYKQSGISSASYSQWNTGRYNPSKKKLESAAACLGVSYEYLLHGNETKKAPTPEGAREVKLDDFTYAMQEETKYLTDMDRQILLSMARQLSKKARQQSNGESE